MIFENIEIRWLGHDGFEILTENKVIYIDPFKIQEQDNKADYLFITHEHFDHCSPEDIKKVIKPETIIIAPAECQSTLLRLKIKNLFIVEPEKKYKVNDLEFMTIPAYNINKFRAPGIFYHPKDDDKVGYIINVGGKNILHCGDTDATKEIKTLKNIDIAMVPVSGKYVMTPEEAAEAVNSFKPKVAIPMHYNEIVGSVSDAEKFKNLARVPVEIIKKGG